MRGAARHSCADPTAAAWSLPRAKAHRLQLHLARSIVSSASRSWLKNQPHPERPEAGAYGDYPDGYRKKHRTAPKTVQWMSGSLHNGPITVDGPHFHW